MWILPKQLHTLVSVQDTEALNLDLNESSQICAQSLFVRSKPSQSRIWSQKWKRDSWSQYLFGRILRPSHGERFVTEWTSLLVATPANHLAQPESDSAQKTQDIFGPTSQAEFGFFDPSSVSLKTSKDTSPSDSEKSLENWNQWVTKCRGAYSQRVKSAHLTSASGCLSLQWPTTAARDYKGTSPGYLFRADGKSRVDQLAVAVDQAEIGNWPTPTVQEAGKIGNQANHGQIALSNHPSLRGEVSRDKYEKGKHGLPAPENPSTLGSRQGLSEEAWPTPTAVNRVRNEETMEKCLKFRQGNGQTSVPLYLEEKVNLVEKKSWATPQQRDYNAAEPLAKWTIRAEEQKAKGVNLHLPLPSQVMHVDEKSWGTPSCMDTLPPRSAEALARAKLKGGCKNLREEVHQWATPNTLDCLPSRSYEAMKRQATVGERKNRSKPGNLREQIDPLMCQAYKDAQAEANQWPTPRANKVHPEITEENRDHLANRNKSNLEEEIAGHCGKTTGKLNPAWVCTLMNLPVFWVKP